MSYGFLVEPVFHVFGLPVPRSAGGDGVSVLRSGGGGGADERCDTSTADESRAMARLWRAVLVNRGSGVHGVEVAAGR